MTGPILFGDETARAQLLRGEVVTFRKSQRTTGETWARWAGPDEDVIDRLSTAKADVLVEEIGEVAPTEDNLAPHREVSGFASVAAWQDAIRELNGSMPAEGYLYRVTLHGRREA